MQIKILRVALNLIVLSYCDTNKIPGLKKLFSYVSFCNLDSYCFLLNSDYNNILE